MAKRFKIVLLVALLALVSSLAAGGFEKPGVADKAKSKDSLYNEVELFADALSMVRSDYVDGVDSKKLIYGAMRGMLESLDDFSQFMEPDEYSEIRMETKGEFGGVGVEISLRDGILTVVTPMVGTPAEAAGVKAGDKIVKLDGKITRGMTINEAVKKMRGKPGTVIMITVWREKEDNALVDIPIKRATIKIRSIKRSEIVEGGIGYIKLVEFQENTGDDLEAALKKLESEGMESLVLDLRNNPGGLLEGSVDVAEKFLTKDKPIVSIKSRIPEQNIAFKSGGKYPHPNYPLVVMVNEGSASASEIVAGAVQDNRRGIVLGTKTYGKASVQTVIPLKDGSALRLTTALYLTPNGKIIKDEGIAPDVVVEKEEVSGRKKENAEDIFDALEADKKLPKKEQPVKEKEKKEAPVRDNQLDMAINLLKAMKVSASGLEASGPGRRR